MLGDADEAEDAVQHTFMAAYSDLLSSEKPIHLRAWLFTIARNRCYTILRARREQPSGDLEEAETEGLASQVQRRQDLRDLVADMRQLPEEQRAALVLAELDSLSHADIAEVLGVPREKVKALVFQARESLLASRTARDTACADIREQLACGRGASLRRANLRRHLRECDGCRAYRAQVEHQRKQFALILPVVPGIALKQALFSASGVGASGVGAAGAGAVGAGALASGALKGGAVKAVVGAVVASVGTAGTLVVAATGVHVGGIVADFEHGFRSVSAPRHSAGPAPRETSMSTAGVGGSSALGHSSLVAGAATPAHALAPVFGFRELRVLTPVRHVHATARASHARIRVQTPFVRHHSAATIRHSSTPKVPSTAVTQTPVTHTPVTQTPVTHTPVTQTPVTQTPVTQTPVTQTPVTQTPVTQTPVTSPVTSTPPVKVVTSTPPAKTSTPSRPTTISTGTAKGSAGTTHASGAPVPTVSSGTGRSSGSSGSSGSGGSSGAGHGGGSAGGGPVTVIGAGRGAGTGTGSRYGAGSGGSTGDPTPGSSGSGTTASSGTASSGTTTTSSGSTGTATTGSTTTVGGTAGSGDTTTTPAATSTPVIGGSTGDTSTTSSSTTTTGTTGSTGTSTTPGRSLEPSPPS